MILPGARRFALRAKAAAAVGDVGAGTIEFVSNGKDVFFIEMNTRLEVEHPVTEMITGIDLVEWQLQAAGEKLSMMQEQITLQDHAIEARVYAENPDKNFMPSVGTVRSWRMPELSAGLRIDAGYRERDTVSPHYDAMLAKVIAWGPTVSRASTASTMRLRNPTCAAWSPIFRFWPLCQATRRCGQTRSTPALSNAN